MKKWQRSMQAVWALVGVLVLSLSPCVAHAGDAAAGKEVYQELCAKCHGENGRGDGPDAATLTTKPADYTDCAKMKTFSDDDLLAIVKDGGPARKLSKDMAPYGDVLEDQELQDLIAFVLSFCKQ